MSTKEQNNSIIEESESECETTPVTWGIEEDENNSDNPECISINSNNMDENTEGNLSWFNYIDVYLDEEDDEISFNISTKDPRGSDIKFKVSKRGDKISLYNKKKDDEISLLKAEIKILIRARETQRDTIEQLATLASNSAIKFKRDTDRLESYERLKE